MYIIYIYYIYIEKQRARDTRGKSVDFYRNKINRTNKNLITYNKFSLMAALMHEALKWSIIDDVLRLMTRQFVYYSAVHYWHNHRVITI